MQYHAVSLSKQVQPVFFSTQLISEESDELATLCRLKIVYACSPSIIAPH